MTKYPLIIFGAGASYDSLDDHNRFPVKKKIDLKKWQPPLTNDIFDRTRFNEILDQYPEAQFISAESYKINKDHSFEDLVTDIQSNLAPKNPIWYQRLISLRFYLHRLFQKITEQYFDYSNNYNRLLLSFEHNGIVEACFVNFNYDLLLEKNISQINNAINVDSYINGPIKVIKIHGACNWFRPVGGGFKTDRDFKNGKDFSISNGKNILESENGDNEIEKVLPGPVIKSTDEHWQYYDDFHTGFKGEVKYFVPDLALPTHKKRDFVCPETHIDLLKNEFQHIDRIIIIGWKAADEFLLRILKEYTGDKPIIIVSPTSAKETKDKIIKDCEVKESQIIVLNKSFTRFITEGYCDKVLSTDNTDILIQDIG